MQKIIVLTTLSLYITPGDYSTLRTSIKNQVCPVPYLTLDFSFKLKNKLIQKTYYIKLYIIN
jgi:hypothetical protein